MIKSWLIKASAPICGTDTYYCAFCEIDPLKTDDFPYTQIIEELWEDYSWALHLDDEDYDSEEERDAIYDQAYEDWQYDCEFDSEEMSLKELQDYIPGGPTSEDDLPRIIYDAR